MRTAVRRALSLVATAALGAAAILVPGTAALAAADLPPTVTIDSPADGEMITQESTLIEFTLDDDLGIDGWEVWLDGALIDSGEIAGALSTTLRARDLANGSHSVTVSVADVGGNVTSDTRNFGVNLDDPPVRIEVPAEYAWVSPQLVLIQYMGDYDMRWQIFADGVLLHSVGPALGGGLLHEDGTWAENSWHQVAVTGSDAGGRASTVTRYVKVDASAPVVTVDPLPASTLPRGTTLTGTATDTRSGVAKLEVYIEAFGGGVCGLIAEILEPTVQAGRWSVALPDTLADGQYCIRVKATDAAGNEATSIPATATVDVHAPVAPVGLAPSGEFWVAPSTLSWSPQSDAVKYEYRMAAYASLLSSVTPSSTTGTSVSLATPLAGSSVWQVRGVDAVGNVGDWSAVAEVVVRSALRFGDACGCGLAGNFVNLWWDAVPDVVSYHVEVTGRAAGVPVVFTQDVAATEAGVLVTLPSTFPTGAISVRMRAELDHAVQGSVFTPWSETVRLLRFGEAAAPVLLGPAQGSYVPGSGVVLAWRDDPSVVVWEVRVSSSPALDSDGVLATTTVSMADPMAEIFFRLLNSDPLAFSDTTTLGELDELFDCARLLQLTNDPDLLCGDGSYRLPTTLPDGPHYWQVRGVSLAALLGSPQPGLWSPVGQFIVGTPPANPAPKHPRASGGSAAPTADVEVAPTVIPATDAPTVAPDPGAAAPPSDSEAPPATAPSGDEFPIGWLLGGLGLLVLLAALALIRFLIRRRR